MLEINTKAPTFTLLNQDGNAISLEEYLGKTVVLYFYPKDNTPGCTTQACSFRDYNDLLKEMDVVVLGVSKDTVESHVKFAEEHRLNFDILADVDGKVIEAYGVWKEKSVFGKTSMGIQRSTFIIDKDGMIEKVYEKASAKENPEEIYTYLKNK